MGNVSIFFEAASFFDLFSDGLGCLHSLADVIVKVLTKALRPL